MVDDFYELRLYRWACNFLDLSQLVAAMLSAVDLPCLTLTHRHAKIYRHEIPVRLAFTTSLSWGQDRLGYRSGTN